MTRKKEQESHEPWGVFAGLSVNSLSNVTVRTFAAPPGFVRWALTANSYLRNCEVMFPRNWPFSAIDAPIRMPSKTSSVSGDACMSGAVGNVFLYVHVPLCQAAMKAGSRLSMRCPVHDKARGQQ